MAEKEESIIEAGQENTNNPEDSGEGTPLINPEGQVEDAQAETTEAAGETEETKEETTEAKADGEKTEEVIEPDKAGAPESYESFKVPEGVEQSDEVLKDFTEVAKELDLSQDSAQKLVDTYFKMGTTAQEEQAQAMAQQSKDWAKMVQEDPTMGGENFEQTKKNIATVKANIPEFKPVYDLFAEWGVGNHPALAGALNALGKLMAEDKFVSAQNSTQQRRSPERVLYPDMN